MNVIDTFTQDIQSPQWWISIVIAGLLIHVVGSYAKPAVDRVISSIWKGWRERTEKRSTAKEKALEELRASETKQVILAVSEMRHRFLGIFYLLVAGAAAYLVNHFLKQPNKPFDFSIAMFQLSIVGFFIIQSLSHWFKGIDEGDLLRSLHDWF